MTYKGTAGKSASGASMSKYDVEVEERLQVLEKKVNNLLLWKNTHDTSDVEDTDSKLERLITILKKTDSLGLDQY